MLIRPIRNKIHRYFTSNCHLCGLTISQPMGETIWCHHCIKSFSPSPRCQRCGLPMSSPVEQCGQCLTNPPLWQRLYCIGDYSEPLSGYVHQLKYQGKFYFAYDLSYLLAEQISQPAPLICTVPLHWKRYIARGYNQSRVIAHYLHQHLTDKTVVNNHIFKRQLATPPQQGLDKKQRLKNLAGAFVLRQVPQHSHVAIVDDVVTTGSTVRHLCKLLLEVGVERIDIYCLCRTPEPSQA